MVAEISAKYSLWVIQYVAKLIDALQSSCISHQTRLFILKVHHRGYRKFAIAIILDNDNLSFTILFVFHEGNHRIGGA